MFIATNHFDFEKGSKHEKYKFKEVTPIKTRDI